MEEELGQAIGRDYSSPPTPEEEYVRPSTFQDYMQTVSGIGIQLYNPQTRINKEEDKAEVWKASDPEVVDYFKQADTRTAQEMLKAASKSHAIKIYERNMLQQDSKKAVAQDPLLVQIGMSIIPSFASYSSLVPVAGSVGALFKLGKMANTISKLERIGRVTGAGAVTGMTANVIDEYAFDVQGMETNYLSSAVAGAFFGGTLGAFAGALTGPSKRSGAYAISKEGDTLSKDLDTDLSIKIDNTDGVPKITDYKPIPDRMSKFITDYLPDVVTQFIKSDVSTMFQSESKTFRQYSKMLVDPTVALKDMDGNLIKQGFTVQNKKIQLENNYRKTLADVEQLFNKHKQTKGYRGNIDDFVDEVSDVYTRAVMKQEKAVYAETNDLLTALDKKWKGKLDTEENLQAFRKEKNDILNKAYEKHQVEFEGPEHLVTAANKFKEYYTKMLENGQKVGIEELVGVSAFKLYRPRAWDFQKIKKMDANEVKARLRDGIASHPNQAGLTAKELDKKVEEVYGSLVKSSFDVDNLTTTYARSTHLPFEKYLKQQRIKVDETVVRDLLKDNLIETTGAYSYRMSGRQALQELTGQPSVGKFLDEMEAQIIANGEKVTPQELKAMQNTIEDIVGTLRLKQLGDGPAWTFTRNATTYNTLRLGGGFGGNQFIELVSSMFNIGIGSAIKSGRLLPALKNSAKLLYTKGEVNDEFAQALLDSGYLSTALHTHKVNRLAETEAGFNASWFENKLNGLSDKYMKFNAMRYFTGVMEDLVGGAIMQDIKRIGKMTKPSDTDLARLSRWGMDHTDAKEFIKDLDMYYSPKEGRFELDKFSQVNRDRFQRAIDKGISEVVIQGDSIHLPPALKTVGPAGKLLTQFLRFPMIAHEVLLRKGYTDEQAKFVASAISSTVAFMGIKYLREQASIALGYTQPGEVKYDYFGANGDKAITTGILSSLNYNAPLGMLTTMYNLGATASGNEELGRDYATNKVTEAIVGPFFGGTIPDVAKVLTDIADGNFGDTARSRQNIKSLLFFQNFPLLHEGTKDFIEGF